MFYPLIPGFVAVLLGVSVVAPPTQAIPIRPEIARPAPRQAALNVPAASAPVTVETPAPVMVVEVVPTIAERAVPVAKAAPVIVVIEASRISLGKLRREALRYDQDMAGRFIDFATECPPLFE